VAPDPGHRLGRRGLSLLFFAILDAIYSISLVAPDEATRHVPLFQWLASIAPLWVWAVLWGATSLVLFWFAFQRRDQVGFSAAIFLKVTWGLVSLGGWIFGDVDRGYVSAAIWLFLAGFVGVLAGWEENPPRPKGASWTPQSSSLPDRSS
jgi:hypothetical protein